MPTYPKGDVDVSVATEKNIKAGDKVRVVKLSSHCRHPSRERDLVVGDEITLSSVDHDIGWYDVGSPRRSWRDWISLRDVEKVERPIQPLDRVRVVKLTVPASHPTETRALNVADELVVAEVSGLQVFYDCKRSTGISFRDWVRLDDVARIEPDEPARVQINDNLVISKPTPEPRRFRVGPRNRWSANHPTENRVLWEGDVIEAARVEGNSVEYALPKCGPQATNFIHRDDVTEVKDEPEKPQAGTCRYWMVHVIGKKFPTYRHTEKANAVREQERLARLNPGSDVVLLESVSVVRSQEAPVEELAFAPEEIPF